MPTKFYKVIFQNLWVLRIDLVQANLNICHTLKTHGILKIMIDKNVEAETDQTTHLADIYSPTKSQTIINYA